MKAEKTKYNDFKIKILAEGKSDIVSLDNKIPYGNGILLAADEKQNFLEVTITTEAKNAPESLWFCFRLRINKRPQRQNMLRLVVKYFYNSLCALPAEKINLIKKSANGQWERMNSGKTVILQDGRADAIWETAITADIMDFAFCFPYGVPEVEELLKNANGYFAKDIIGISTENRNIIRLSNNYGHANDTKREMGLYLIARQHSGETSGSWVLHGLLERLAEKKAKNLTVWSLPLTNIDGIERGDYGKDNFPMDLNRAWGTPPMRYENKVFQNDIALWASRSNPFLALDFHSPGGNENQGCYCFLPKTENMTLDKISLKWAKRFAQALPDDFACKEFGRIATHASRWEAPCFSYHNFMNKFYKIPALSFEIPYSRIGDKILSIANYREIGHTIADVVIETASQNKL